MSEQCLHYTRPGQSKQRVATVDANDFTTVRIGDKITVGGRPAIVTCIHGTVPLLPPATIKRQLEKIVSPRLRSDQYAEETGMAYPLTDDSIFSERLAPEMQWSITSGRDGGAW